MRTNTEFMKAGAQGLTIMFAAGYVGGAPPFSLSTALHHYHAHLPSHQ